MMKRNLMVTVCCALILCALLGCQLARENAGTNSYEDRLIGIFITTEYLDLFDFEGYLSDNHTSFRGGEITMSGNTQPYQGRLYATQVTKTLTNEETSDTIETEEYVFEGIEGISYFSPTVPATVEHESYVTTMSDGAISDGHISINVGDDRNSRTMEGTLYVTPSVMNPIYYFNPVYQSADGIVYLVSGGGISTSGIDSEGAVMSQTLDAVYTVTENGKTKANSISVRISISVMFVPKKISILQMSADNTLISRAEYEPDAMPGIFAPETDTAYLIVETHKRDETRSLKISREIYDRGAENIETFFARADGICVKHWTRII